MAKPNRFWAGLHLLDRQIVDKNGRLAGNVDDVRFEANAKGELVLVSLRSGPGVLASRLGARRLGDWLARVHETLDGQDGEIPITKVTKLGPHIEVDLVAADMSCEATERWFRNHVISRIPGSDHAAE